MKDIPPLSKEQNQAKVICQKCKREKVIDLSKYSEKSGSLKGTLTCTCGQKYSFVVDRRRYDRKGLNIKGIFVVTTNLERFEIYGSEEKATQGKAIIKDISITGLKLQFPKRPNINVNDNMLIEFYLDTDKRDLICKQVIVRNIEGGTIGVEFKDHHLDDHMNRIIGRFVLNQGL